jgi:uncharacterized membrane protein
MGQTEPDSYISALVFGSSIALAFALFTFALKIFAQGSINAVTGDEYIFIIKLSIFAGITATLWRVLTLPHNRERIQELHIHYPDFLHEKEVDDRLEARIKKSLRQTTALFIGLSLSLCFLMLGLGLISGLTLTPATFAFVILIAFIIVAVIALIEIIAVLYHAEKIRAAEEAEEILMQKRLDQEAEELAEGEDQEEPADDRPSDSEEEPEDDESDGDDNDSDTDGSKDD